MPLEQIKELGATHYKQELTDTFDLYPNMKLVFMVRDPRSFVAARLRRVYSLKDRRQKFPKMLKYWYKLNSELVKICDSFPGKCHLVRHEDLIIRPKDTIKSLTGKEPIDY